MALFVQLWPGTMQHCVHDVAACSKVVAQHFLSTKFDVTLGMTGSVDSVMTDDTAMEC